MPTSAELYAAAKEQEEREFRDLVDSTARLIKANSPAAPPPPEKSAPNPFHNDPSLAMRHYDAYVERAKAEAAEYDVRLREIRSRIPRGTIIG